MKIALIWPRSTFLESATAWPNLGLLYLAAQLEAQGHSCDYFDLNVDPMPADGIYDQLWLSATSPQMSEIKRVAQETSGWRTKRVLGGAAAWSSPESVLGLGYDLVVSGESDHPPNIETVVDTARSGIFSHLTFPVAPNLDWVLPPERRWSKKYHAFIKDRHGLARRATTIFTSRGCPMSCAFCNSGRLGTIWDKYVRYESLDLVEAQLKEISKMGFEALTVYDDILPLNKQRTLKIMELTARYNLVFRCFLRSDIICKQGGYDYLRDLQDGGLVECFIGVESGSNQIKSNISKGTTIEQDTAVLDWCKQLGIRVKCSFILGLPGETMETMQATRAWIFEHLPSRVQVDRLVPFKGTPLVDHPETYDLKYEIQPDDDWFYRGKIEEMHSFVSTSHLKREEIDAFWHSLERELQAAGIHA